MIFWYMIIINIFKVHIYDAGHIFVIRWVHNKNYHNNLNSVYIRFFITSSELNNYITCKCTCKEKGTCTCNWRTVYNTTNLIGWLVTLTFKDWTHKIVIRSWREMIAINTSIKMLSMIQKDELQRLIEEKLEFGLRIFIQFPQKMNERISFMLVKC